MSKNNIIYSIKKVLLECDDIWFCYMNNTPYFKIYLPFEKLQSLTKGEIKLKPNKQYEGKYPVTFKIENRKHYLHFFKPCIDKSNKTYKCDVVYKVSEMSELLKLCFQIMKTLESKRFYSDLDEVITKRNLRLLDN